MDDDELYSMCFSGGYIAYHSDEHNNPHKTYTFEYESWEIGWDTARRLAENNTRRENEQ